MGGVGLVDSFVEIAHAVDHDGGSEGFLCHSGTALRHIDQHDRTDHRFANAVDSAHNGCSARVERILHVAAHHLGLRGHRHGAVRRRRFAARVKFAGPCRQFLHELVKDLLVGVHPLNTHAGLPGITHGSEESRVDGPVNVSVGVDEEGVLAAEFHDHGRETLGGARHDLAARGRGAGERNLVDPGMNKGCSGGAVARNELQHRLLGYDSGEGLDHPLANRGGEFARLEDHRISGCQGIRHGTSRRKHRVVPGSDHAHHAQRLVPEPGRLVHGEHRGPDLTLTQDLLGLLGGPVDVFDRQGDFEQGIFDRLSVLAMHEPGQLVCPTGKLALPGE